MREYKLSEPIAIRPIKTEADYEDALAEIEKMMGHVEPNTPEYDKLDLLITLREAYEEIHYPMGETSESNLYHRICDGTDRNESQGSRAIYRYSSTRLENLWTDESIIRHNDSSLVTRSEHPV